MNKKRGKIIKQNKHVFKHLRNIYSHSRKVKVCQGFLLFPALKFGVSCLLGLWASIQTKTKVWGIKYPCIHRIFDEQHLYVVPFLTNQTAFVFYLLIMYLPLSKRLFGFTSEHPCMRVSGLWTQKLLSIASTWMHGGSESTAQVKIR